MVLRRLAAVIAPLLPLAACGGGGSAASPAVVTPTNLPATPTAAVVPSAPVPVVIFADPVPQAYVSLGASTLSAGDGYTSIDKNARLTDVSLDAVDQPQLRYAAGGYEIQVPGGTFDRLIHYKGLLNPTTANNFFQPESARQNLATFIVSRMSLDGYLNTELASWTDAASRRSGAVAFGRPTPTASIPTAGSATYRGSASGLVDITAYDGLYAGYYFDNAAGTVTLTIDFATRTVRGTLDVAIASGKYPRSIPLSATLSAADISSGSFEVSDAGFNGFKLRFTGPDASELIGSWAAPVTLDGTPHQLMGAWVARR